MAGIVRAAQVPVLYSLRTDQVDPRPIPGTNGAYQPVFSPDGEWICFETQGKVNKVRLDGSEPIPIATGGNANGADWTTLDEIILGSEKGRPGLTRFSSGGGDPTEFVKPDKSKGETDYLWPIAFPDGKAVVFAVWTGRLTTSTLALASVNGGNVAYLGVRGIRPLAIVDGKLIYVQADGAVMGIAMSEGRRRSAPKNRVKTTSWPVVAGAMPAVRSLIPCSFAARRAAKAT